MKLSHLSIAILSAITLAACGGGGSSQSLTNTDSGTKPVDQAPVDHPPVQPMDPSITEQEIIVDPSQTGVVGKLDFKKESSVGTTQYIRNKDSKFDRINNPSESTSATSIFGVSVNKQNPYLTNIGLARLTDKAHPDMTLVQYLGVDEENPSLISRKDSLQQQNKHNVQFRAMTTGSTGTVDILKVPELDKVTAQIGKVDVLIKGYQDNLSSLSDTQKLELKKLQSTKAELEALKANFADKKTFGQGLFAVTKGQVYWGDLVKTTPDVVNTLKASSGNGASVTPTTTTGPIANGLVGVNVGEDSRTAAERQKLGLNDKFRIVGTEERSNSSTRIFGRNHSHSAGSDYNSYSEATTFVALNDLTSYADPSGKTLKDYTDTYKNATSKELKWSLAAQPAILEHVQYGRVTGDLDPLGFSPDQIAAGEKISYQQRPYLTKGTGNAVDTYFYRGADVSTLEQMKAEAAKGQTLVYRGHALMYGIDNEYHGITSDEVPTAFGKTDMEGIGNFVEAKVDLAKGNLYEGFVYNVFHDKNARATVRDKLVEFSGNIYGNTVIGEAKRTYNKTDKADFRASFFGENAEELGGSFNSTTYQERYGAKGDVWGGVFGAKKVGVPVSSTLSNQQLGDISGK